MNHRWSSIGAAIVMHAWTNAAQAQDRAVERPADEEVPPPPEKEPLTIARAQREPEHYPLPNRDTERAPEALTAVISFELGGQGEHVDLDGAKTGAGGSLSGRMFLVGYSGTLTYRIFVNGALGGQTTGFLTRFGGDASMGPALRLGGPARLFVRIGVDAQGHEDDELDASVFDVPSAYGGLQLTTKDVLFEIGPRAGATLRAVYAPGNETEGRRHARRSRVSPSWGGTMALVSPLLLLEASLTRVEQHAGLWQVEGSACPVLFPKGESIFVLCASAQHWRGAVSGPLGNLPDVASWVLGASIGYGLANNKRSP